MQHTIPISSLEQSLGPQAASMAHAVESCVHCGFCLAACPTYQVLGEEMDSPRGRIVLMKSVLEGEVSLADAAPYIDRCLGCLACVTACPSGVKYNELVTPFKAYLRSQDQRTMITKVQHSLVCQTLPYPGRFRTAAALGKLARPVRAVLPEGFQGMIDMLPENLPVSRPLPAFTPAEGEKRARVALLIGCVQQALSPEINWATLRVLARNGVEVIIPADQCCCGALPLHTGDEQQARGLARTNLTAFPEDVDAILTTAAGCGSGIMEYPMLFKGLPELEKAEAFSRRVRDISSFLDALGPVNPPELPNPVKAAYHDACHLLHAQGIAEAPRRLLQSIPNLSLLEIPDAGNCCGSAGTYNLVQPEIAARLGERKAENILQTEADVVVTGNIGCMVQIQKYLQSAGKILPVYHTIELLDRAYRQAL